MIYLLYVALTLALLYFVYMQWQYMSIFHPKLYRDMTLYDDSYTFLTTVTQDGTTLEGCRFEPQTPPHDTLLYFGGRGQDSVGLLPKLAELYPQCRIVTFNYRGYGKSGGRPSERAIFEDSLHVMRLVQKHYSTPHIMGYSLGSSVAAYVASKIPPRRFYLIGAFCSIASLTRQRFGRSLPFLRYSFDTCEYLKNVPGGVCLFASKDDNVVAFASVLELVEHAKKKVECFEVYEGLNHVELLWDARVHERIRSLCYSSSSSTPSQNSS